jgi:hypothetical protein
MHPKQGSYGAWKGKHIKSNNRKRILFSDEYKVHA